LDHEKVFVMGAYLGDQFVGEGSGNSKKEAQTAAAAVALGKKEIWMKGV
jgi:dsRNA-specific ribonuclease